MKKTLVMTIILALIISLTSFVNAADSVTANIVIEPTEVQEGEFTVKVQFSEVVRAAIFNVEYDNDVVEYVAKSAGANKETINDKSVKIGLVNDDRDVVELKFKLKDTAKKDDKITFKFVPFEDGVTTEEGRKTIAAGATDSITVAEKTPTNIPDTPDDNPSSPSNPSNPSNPSDDDSNDDDATLVPSDSNNNGGSTTASQNDDTTTTSGEPTKMPQTGVNYVAVLAVVMLVVLGAVAVKKSIRK